MAGKYLVRHLFNDVKSEVLMSIQTERQRASQVIAELYQNSFFERYWNTIGNFLGSGKQRSIWVNAAIVMGANLSLGVIVSALLGETQFTTLKAILVNVIWVVFSYFAVLLMVTRNSRLVEFLQFRFVRSLRYGNDIHEFLLWVNQWIGRLIPQLFVSLGFGIASALVAFYGIFSSSTFSLGQTLIYFINFFHLGVGFYGALALLALMLRLPKWFLVLYDDDPASSSILLLLSRELRDYLLLFASLSATLFLLAGMIYTLNIILIIGFLILNWIPILALFILGNQAFSQQIVRAKYERLDKLQSKIMKLSNIEKMDKDSAAYIKILMDYHDRVKSSRNSLYNSESFINLIGSLALPSLAAILSAIDVWQKIFGKP